MPSTSGLHLRYPNSTDSVDVVRDISNLATDVEAATLSRAQALVATTVKTTAYTAAPGNLIPVDATGGTVAITLPSTPVDKTRVAVKLIAVSGTNTATVTRSGSDVFNKTGGSTSLTLKLLNEAVSLQYDATTHIWYVQSTDVPLSGLDARFAALSNAPNPVASMPYLDAGLSGVPTWVDRIGASAPFYVGNPTLSEFTSSPSQIQLIRYIGAGYQQSAVSALLTQACLIRLKAFEPFTADSQQANAVQCILTSLDGLVKYPTKPSVADETDTLVTHGWLLLGRQARASGHIGGVEAQGSATDGTPSRVDFTQTWDRAAKSARDAGTLVLQDVTYSSEDPFSGIAGKLGAHWSMKVPYAISSADSLVVSATTTTQGHLNAAASVGASSVTLMAGHGAGGFYNNGPASAPAGSTAGANTSAFAAGQSVVLGVGKNSEVLTIAAGGVVGDVITFTGTLKNAHAQYDRLAVLDSNGHHILYASAGLLTTKSNISAQGFQGIGFTCTANNGASFFQTQAQTGGAVGTPNAATGRFYQGTTKVFVLKHEDGIEAPIRTGHRRTLNANTTLTALDGGIIARTSTTTPVTFTLPAANGVPSGFEITFKDESGDASTSAITIQRAGADDISVNNSIGSSKLITTDGGTLTLYSTGGTRWFNR